MQAIQTKYIGPTNTRPSRIKAFCEAGSVTVSYNHSLNSSDGHRAAAKALIQKLGWNGEWVEGCICGSGHVYVRVAPWATFAVESEQ